MPAYSHLYKDAVPLDSVDLNFVSLFTIETRWSVYLLNSWKEITPECLQRLVRFIKPTTQGRHPVHYDKESSNSLLLAVYPNFNDGIIAKLFSLHLPVDAISLWVDENLKAELEAFCKTLGPLYKVKSCRDSLTQNAVDALIEKFVPVDGGEFLLGQHLSKDQLEKLVVKCGMSDKKVGITVAKEDDRSDDLTKFFNFEKYYSKKRISHGVVTGVRERAKLAIRAWRPTPNELYFDWVEKDVAMILD
uniref:Sulfotransfer_1 domain-containing protein n=1 Tax=Steinernema glaseri TaxID=37863 RepID=A0A1I7Z7L0_9BILA